MTGIAFIADGPKGVRFTNDSSTYYHRVVWVRKQELVCCNQFSRQEPGLLTRAIDINTNHIVSNNATFNNNVARGVNEDPIFQVSEDLEIAKGFPVVWFVASVWVEAYSRL